MKLRVAVLLGWFFISLGYPGGMFGGSIPVSSQVFKSKEDCQTAAAWVKKNNVDVSPCYETP